MPVRIAFSPGPMYLGVYCCGLQMARISAIIPTATAPETMDYWVAKRLIVKRVVKIRMAGARRPRRPRRQGALLIENCASAGVRSGEDLPTKQGREGG